MSCCTLVNSNERPLIKFSVFSHSNNNFLKQARALLSVILMNSLLHLKFPRLYFQKRVQCSSDFLYKKWTSAVSTILVHDASVELTNTKHYWDNQVKEDEMGGHVSCMGKMTNAYSILVRKPKGKIPLGRPRYRWEDNIRWILRK
jgi:hypothetical protein